MPPSTNSIIPQVLEYLSKKGYSRTEAMLRRESLHTDANGQPNRTALDESLGRAFIRAFTVLTSYIENTLDIYKPELKRVLWPVFVYSFLHLVADFYPRDAQQPHRRRHADLQ